MQNDTRFAARHNHTHSTPCVSYWETPQLGKDELKQLFSRACEQDVACSIASFSGTPVATIRAAIAESDTILGPVNDTAGLAAAC